MQEAAASGGAGRKLLAIGRQLLESAADIQRRADVVFVGFVFMTLLDLGLLVLFGVQHPSCKQRSPRVYISGVDQGASQQGGGKERGNDRISLQARPWHRQPCLLLTVLPRNRLAANAKHEEIASPAFPTSWRVYSHCSHARVRRRCCSSLRVEGAIITGMSRCQACMPGGPGLMQMPLQAGAP